MVHDDTRLLSVMARQQLKDFCGGFGVSTAIEVSVEDTVNLQPEIQEIPGAKSQTVMYGSPGTQYAADLGLVDSGNTGPMRGMTEIERYSYFACGQTLFQQDVAGTIAICSTGAINTGHIGNDGQSVQFASSDTQLLVVSNGDAFLVVDRSLSAVGSPPWTTAIDCAYLDGYFIVLDDTGDPAGGQFFISVDASTWDPLDFSNAPASNNKLQALAVDHGELWIFGTVVTQVFYNNGNADFPFVPNPSGVIQQGIIHKDTRVQLDNTLYWIGRNQNGMFQAFLAEGYTPRRISTHQIEREWERELSTQLHSWAYQLDGHSIYHVTATIAKRSWRFDRSTNRWHRVMYRNPTTGLEEAHIGSCHIQRNSNHLIGDRRNQILWVMTPTVYVDEYGWSGGVSGFNGSPLVSYRVSPDGYAGNKGVFYQRFELITPTGIGDGTTGTAEENPEWMLSWSSDNGHTFGNEFLLAAGKVGEYNNRVFKVGCGWGRNRVWKVSFSANLPRCILGAEVDLRVGRS